MLISNRASAVTGIVAGGFKSQLLVQREVTVTIPAGKVSAAQTGFQVKIDLSDLPGAFWAGIQSNGGNLRAYTSGGTELPIDLPYIDMTNKAGWAFVRIDVPTTGVMFYLRTIDGATAYADNATYGMAAVWNGFATVFSGQSLKNRASASGEVFATQGSGYTANFTDRPGWASFVAADNTRAPFQALGGKNTYGWTIRCAARSLQTITTATDYVPICHGQNGWTGTYQSYYYNYLAQYSSAYKLHGHTRNYNISSSTDKVSDVVSTNSNVFPSNEDESIAWTVATFAHNLFVNGVNVGSTTSENYTDNSSYMNAPGLTIGSLSYAGYNKFAGFVTDAYLALGAMDVNRLKAEHDNWNWAKAGKGFYIIA